MTWAIFNQDVQTRAIGELITTGSERVLAVVGGALLDEHVRRTLTERLRNDVGARDQLLDVERPLGNLGPKIDLLYLLYGIDSQTRITLKAIANIRNYFAHDLTASFDSVDADFSKSVGRLKSHEGKTHYPNPLKGGTPSEIPIEQINNRRNLFTVNLKLGLIALMQDRLSHDPYSNQPKKTDETGSAPA